MYFIAMMEEDEYQRIVPSGDGDSDQNSLTQSGMMYSYMAEDVPHSSQSNQSAEQERVG